VRIKIFEIYWSVLARTGGQDWETIKQVTLHRSSTFIFALIGTEIRRPFKGTVSPAIVFYFRVYKFKSVLLVRPLMVLNLLIS
jgi:hypothetical protein